MRKIDKPKNLKTKSKNKNLLKKTNLPVKNKTKTAKTTADYYNCCAQKTKSWLKGVKITAITHHCKNNSQKLALIKNKARESEKKKILNSWKQIGLSLGKIIASA